AVRPAMPPPRTATCGRRRRRDRASAVGAPATDAAALAAAACFSSVRRVMSLMPVLPLELTTSIVTIASDVRVRQISSVVMATRAPQRTYGGVSADERIAARRAKLLEAGLELFGTRGFATTGVKDVC